ncbi:MAG: hypothetical protein K9M08_03070 [Pirellula sp.]|jgi:hypothetical protein|nr:hypothetical protein [Pirellula sp.]
MKRFYALFKQTWWLWTIYLTLNIGLIFFVSPVFLAVLPMIVVVFIYFALVRYDDEGNFTGA